MLISGLQRSSVMLLKLQTSVGGQGKEFWCGRKREHLFAGSFLSLLNVNWSALLVACEWSPNRCLGRLGKSHGGRQKAYGRRCSTVGLYPRATWEIQPKVVTEVAATWLHDHCHSTDHCWICSRKLVSHHPLSWCIKWVQYSGQGGEWGTMWSDSGRTRPCTALQVRIKNTKFILVWNLL